MLAAIGNFILDYFFNKLVAWAKAFVAMLLRREVIKKEEEVSVDPLKKANPESEKEIDDSIKDALNGL